MKTLLRTLGGLIGAGLAFVGFYLWMLSNDLPEEETGMKLAGAAGMAMGLLLVGVALFLKGTEEGGEEDDP